MILSPRLALRAWRQEDKPRFRDIINTPAMMTHFGGVAPAAAMDALVDAQIASEEADGFSMWAVDWRETGELIGICGLRRARQVGTPVLGMLDAGWRIAERFWRRGIAREAAEASFAWAWANTGEAEVIAYTGSGNEPSWRLMEQLGMRRRAGLDFRHPGFGGDDPLGKMIVHSLDRPRR